MNRNFFMTVICLTALLLPIKAGAEEKISLCADVNNSSSNKSSYLKDITAGNDGWIFAGLDFPALAPFDADLADAFSRLGKALAERKTELMMVVVPPRGLLAYEQAPSELMKKKRYDQTEAERNYRARLMQFEKMGIAAPDLLMALSKVDAPDKVFFRRDHHWTPFGAQLAAQAVADTVRKSSAYVDMTKSDFTLIEGKQVTNEGSIETVVEKACGKDIADELYTTTLTTEKSKSAGLLDDAGADIVLVGTSLSNRDERDSLNFVGALRHYIGVDIDNRAVAGGGTDTSPISYLQSEDFINAPPKLLIWEMPANYLLSDYSKMMPLFSQLIPQVKGACSDKNALAKGAGTLGQSATLIAGQTTVAAASDFIYIEVSDRSLTEFVLTFKGANNQDEQVAINRKTRAVNSGRYYVEVPKAVGNTIREIGITSKQKVSGTFVARLCAGQ